MSQEQAFGFDFDNIKEEENTYGPVKPGKYIVKIREASIKPTKTGGFYVSLQLMIEGPTSAGRIVYDNLNIKNASKEAEDIGQGRLKAIMLCLGFESSAMKDKTPKDLVNNRVLVNLGLDKNDSSRNKVFSYERLTEEQALNGTASPSTDDTKKAPSWF